MPALQKKHKKSSVHNIKSVMNTRYGARYRTLTDKKVFWLVPFYAGKYHNVGELCNFIAISC